MINPLTSDGVLREEFENLLQGRKKRHKKIEELITQIDKYIQEEEFGLILHLTLNDLDRTRRNISYSFLSDSFPPETKFMSNHWFEETPCTSTQSKEVFKKP